MLDRIKKRLIHFNTDGASVVSDFVSARQKRAGLLRRVVHVCFYIQCAAALTCVVCGFAMGGALTGGILAVGAAASAGAALMAVSGDFVVRTISYMLDLVYAVICFVIGGGLFTLCGLLMLIAAASALAGFAAGYFRDFLRDYSPLKLTPADYTLTGGAVVQPKPITDVPQQLQDPVPPKPEPKSELLLIAEQVSQIMNAARVPPEEPAEQAGGLQGKPVPPQEAAQNGELQQVGDMNEG